MMDMSIVESDTQVESDDEILEGSYFEDEKSQFKFYNSALINLATPKKLGDKTSNFFSPMSVDGTPYRESFLTDFKSKDNNVSTAVSRLSYKVDGENGMNKSIDRMIIDIDEKAEASFYNGSFDVIDKSLNEDVNCSKKQHHATSHINRPPFTEIGNDSERFHSAIGNESESIIVVDSSDESFSNDLFSIKDRNLKKLINDSRKSNLSLPGDVSKPNRTSLSEIGNNKENKVNESKSILILDSDDDADGLPFSSNGAIKIKDRNFNSSTKSHHNPSNSSNSISKTVDDHHNSYGESFSKHFVADESDSDCIEVSSPSDLSSSETRSSQKKRSPPYNKMSEMSYIEKQLKDKKFKPDIKSLGIVDYQLSFLSSLSDKTYGLKCDPVAEFFKLHFRTSKTSLARHLYYIFNELVFGNQLPKFMPLKWSNKLKTACGITTTKFEADRKGNAIFAAYITLSKKIITTAERLRDTLVHEMCHAAVWIINNAGDSHGSLWKMWALKARVTLPELPEIARCHSYEINYKYIYKCKDCGYRIGRSRPSEKLLGRCLCGYCGGKFRLCEEDKDE